MKAAQLWKRILHEGVANDPFDGDILIDIMRSQIICDTTPRDADEPFDLSSLVGTPLAMPFDRFWIEHPKHDDWLVGSHVMRVSMRDDEAPKYVVQPIIAFDSRPPTALRPYLLNFDPDNILLSVEDYGMGEPEGHEFAEQRITYFACSSLMLMDCKNVSLAARDNTPRHARIAAKRHGGNPDDYRYHVLVVRPAGARSDAPAQELGTMPHHVCRGHFSEYGPKYGKGLLFGKYEGRFYVPPHLKGDKKNGTVAKDYEVRV